jgi:hypothetical protein
MGRVARGDAKTKLALVALAVAVVAGLMAPAPAQASRTANPGSLDFGTIKNGPAGGERATRRRSGSAERDAERGAQILWRSSSFLPMTIR